MSRKIIKKLLSITAICTFALSLYNITHGLEMAITIDDLPTAGKLPSSLTRIDVIKKMLQALKKHHITGVYGFINASKVGDNKNHLAILSAWIEGGQLLGNHTFSHMDLAKVDITTYIQDIEKNEPYLQKFMGDKNYKYFRYPYLVEGNTEEKRNRIREYLTSHQYIIAEVTTDFYDYMWNNPYVRCLQIGDKEAINWLEKNYLEQSLNALTISHELSTLLFNRDIKYILLLHVTLFDAEMLDKLLTLYEEHGVKFISLEEALNDDVYKINPNVINKSYTFLDLLRISKGLKNPPNVNQLYKSFPEDKLKNLCKINK